jgi:hypothetical protein
MCGRFTTTFEFSDIRVRWNLDRDLSKYTPRYNVAPDTSPNIPVIVRHKKGNGIHNLCAPIILFSRAATLCLLVLVMVLLWLCPTSAAPVAVRFVEGLVHGFLVLRTVNGVPIASGDLLQVQRGGQVESRMVFRFKDGSVYDETVVFTQERVFTMQSYHLVHRGPAFTEDTEISLERASGKYRVKTKAHKDGREQVLNGTLDLPPDVYNGMVITIAKNLPKGASEIVHIVAFTPTPRLIQLEFVPEGEQKVLIGELGKTATHYVLRPRLGIWLKLFAAFSGPNQPPIPTQIGHPFQRKPATIPEHSGHPLPGG